jgi:hypothetical protein
LLLQPASTRAAAAITRRRIAAGITPWGGAAQRFTCVCTLDDRGKRHAGLAFRPMKQPSSPHRSPRLDVDSRLMTESSDALGAPMIRRVEALLTEIETDKQKAKAKEEAEAWTKPAAVSLVIIAVLAATAVQRSAGFGSRSLKHLNASIYDQVKASDEWSFFQSKSTKGHVYELGVDLLRHLGPNGAEEEKMIGELTGKMKKYEKEKDEIQGRAREMEKLRDEERVLAEVNAKAGGELNYSVLGFQVSIAVASIGLVMKRKPLWFASMAVGAAATGWMIYCLLHAPPA